MDIASIAKRLSYKPGVKLVLEFDKTRGMVRLHTTEMVKDATGAQPGLIPLHFDAMRPVETLTDEQDLLHWIRGELGRRETHERDEWLQLDGWAPFYPH